MPKCIFYSRFMESWHTTPDMSYLIFGEKLLKEMLDTFYIVYIVQTVTTDFKVT